MECALSCVVARSNISMMFTLRSFRFTLKEIFNFNLGLSMYSRH